MIRCTEKGCPKTCPRNAEKGTPHEQGWRWRWTSGWRCPLHPPYFQSDARGGT